MGLPAALYPIDTIKTRLQLARSGGGIRALIQAGGGKALYAGIWGNLLGVAPSTGVFMAIYEPLKQVCAEAAQRRKVHSNLYQFPFQGLLSADPYHVFFRLHVKSRSGNIVNRGRIHNKSFSGTVVVEVAARAGD